jgi:hypothetical protein
MNTTGKLDKLIEEKVDKQLRDFSNNITNQIKDFLIANGDYSGNYLYQASNWKSMDSIGEYYEPIDYRYLRVTDFYKNIKGGLELSIKEKMITRETKELLSKVSLLS